MVRHVMLVAGVLALLATACSSSGKPSTTLAVDAEPAVGAEVSESMIGADPTSEREPTSGREPEPVPTSRPEPEPTSRPEPGPTSRPEPTLIVPTADLDEVIGGQPNLMGWVVEPGVYTSSRLQRPLLFDVGEPVTFFDWDGAVVFGREGLSGEQRDIAIIAEFVGIIPDTDAAVHPPHDPIMPVNTEPVPDDLGQWFAALSQVVVTDSGSRMVLGEMADYWDVELEIGDEPHFPCFLGRCVAFLVKEGAGAFVLGDELRFRIYQLAGDMRGVFVFVQAAPGEFDRTVEFAERIIDGMYRGETT